MACLKLSILASRGGSNMQAIIDRIGEGRLDARVVLVISNNPGSGAVERARKAGLPCQVLNSKTYPDPDLRDVAMLNALVDAGTELMCLAGYMKRIGPRTLAAFKGRMINIHPSLLPHYGGAGMYGIRPHEAVLAAGETETGVTVHVVTERYDEGPILGQRRVRVEPGDSPQSLQKRVLAVEHQLYSDTIAEIIAEKHPLPIPTD